MMLPLLGTLAAITLPGVGVFRALAHRRGARRNDEGRCAVCGHRWAARYPDVEQYLLDGQTICAACGTRLRRRLRRGGIAIGAVIAGVGLATIVSNGFDMYVGGLAFSWWTLFYWVAPVTTFGAIAALGARKLKAENRAALPRTTASDGLPATLSPPGA